MKKKKKIENKNKAIIKIMKRIEKGKKKEIRTKIEWEWYVNDYEVKWIQRID